MKVKTFKTDEETNAFLADPEISAEKIMMDANGNWGVVYKELVEVEIGVYQFGYNSLSSTTWINTKYRGTETEVKKMYKEWVEREFPQEDYRAHFRCIGTEIRTEWR